MNALDVLVIGRTAPEDHTPTALRGRRRAVGPWLATS